jgi:hypothetical protein
MKKHLHGDAPHWVGIIIDKSQSVKESSKPSALLRHRPSQGEDIDTSGTGFKQSFRAMVNGGSGGHYVINECNPFALPLSFITGMGREGACHIMETLVAGESGLWRGVFPAN